MSTRYLYRWIKSYFGSSLPSAFPWYYVHTVHRNCQEMSIVSVISMLWYPICTRTAPSMKKERRLIRIQAVEKVVLKY